MPRNEVMTCAEVFRGIKEKKINMPSNNIYSFVSEDEVKIFLDELPAIEEVKKQGKGKVIKVSFEDEVMKKWIDVFVMLKRSRI